MELLEIILVTTAMVLAIRGNSVLSVLSYWESEEYIQRHIMYHENDYNMTDADLEEHTKVA